MFHTDLNAEYLLCHTEFGLGPAELTQLARTGVHAAFCSETTRSAVPAEIDDVQAVQSSAFTSSAG